MTNSETIYRHKFSRSACFHKIRGRKLSRMGPKNAKTEKLSANESFFPLGILKCAFYFLEAFFHCQQYMILVSINDWFLRGEFKGTQSSGFEKKSNLCVFFLSNFFIWKFRFLKRKELKLWTCIFAAVFGNQYLLIKPRKSID